MAKRKKKSGEVGRPATGHDPLRSIRISDQLWKAAKKKAANRGESVGAAIRGFLERYVKRK